MVVGELWLCQTLSVEMQLHFKQNPSFVTLVLFDSSHCTIWLQYDTEPVEQCLPGGQVRLLFWVEREENPFPSKYLIFFPMCTPRFSGLPPATLRQRAQCRNQRNDSKFNPCADPILGRNRRKTCAFKISFISYHLHPVLSDFQVFCRYCISDQRNDSVLTPKMWAVLGFLEEQS